MSKGWGLSEAELRAQAERCPCRGANDMCVCQNVPDAITVKERDAGADHLRGPQRVWGVSRDADNPKVLIVSFAEPPSDDDLRAVHEAATRAIAEVAARKAERLQ